jgi:CRP/FNR family transcriptional regulator, cyclic AMP receptor protein
MQKRSKQPRVRERGVLFGEPIIDPPGHLSARYPFPARLNKHYVAKLKASDAGTSFPKGAFLFQEGAKPRGVHVVLEGRVKLSINSSQGKTLLLGFFGPGTILGLAAAILGSAHAATAEVLKPTRVVFVSRMELVREMQGDATVARQVAELVSEACYFLLGKMRAVDLSQSAPQKLARCLLGLLAHNPGSSGETSSKLDLSQEAIAQMIGLSRETVARLLSRFRRRHILDWKRSGLVIRDKRALEKLADFSETVASLAGGAFADRAVLTRDAVTSHKNNVEL